MPNPPAHLKAYLPAVSLRGAGSLAEPTRRTLWASCLWLDMSGFTPLTERLSAEGPDGIERLSQTLNALYTAVAGAASATGGDVMFFAGDGALCLWEAAGAAQLTESTARAAHSALQLLDRLTQANAGGIQIELRQVVVAGELTLDTVGGDEGVWQDVAGGEPLSLLSQLGTVCRKGQVLLSESAAKALGTRATTLPNQDGGRELVNLLSSEGDIVSSRTPESSPEMAAAAVAKVPRFLANQLSQARTPQSELRRISVVFSRWKTKLCSSTSNLQDLTLVLQQAARRHHGWLCQLVQDDKGLSGVTVFGLPGQAQGEDGLRAVRFASDAAGQCDRLGLKASFGVATGSAFCGVRGGATRSQYCVLGNPVNLAARLADHATDTPLVDETTFASAHWRVDFTRHGALQLKGLPHAVEAFRPGTARDMRLAPSSLVSFEAERSELAAWLHDFVVRGDNRLLLVCGELGAGKTAFLGHVPEHCAESGVDVASSACEEFDEHTAYFALRSVMRRLLGDPADAAGVTSLKAQLAELDQADQLALLNPLLSADFESTPLLQQMSPETRTENRKQLVIELLRRRLSGRRLVVIIDDAQWLDAASRELLTALRTQLPNLTSVLAERGQRSRLREHLAGARELSIQPLSAEAVGRLVAQLLRASQCDAELSRAICQSAGGNPLHCTELTRALLNSQRLEVTADHVRMAGGQSELLEVPGTLEELIQARFDGLSEATRDVLRSASVLGTLLDLPALAEMLRATVDATQLSAALEEALDAGIVRSRGTHQFEHASIQAVVYRLLLPSEQRQLHERAARALAKVHSAAPELVAARLAHHWLRAGNAERAAFFSAMAADQALQGYANADAEHLFRQAIEQDTAFRGELAVSLERARWSMLMSQAQYSQSRHGEARQASEAAMRFTGMAVPGGLGQLPLTVARLLGWAMASKLGIKPRPAQGATREQHILTTRIINAALALDAWEGRLYEAANKAVIAYLLSRSISDSPEAAETVAGLGYLLASTPARRYAQGMILEGIHAADASDDLQARTSTRVLLGMCHTLSGQTALAEAPLGVAQQLAERLGSGLWRHRAWFGLGEALLWGGKLEPAAQAFQRAAEIAALAEPPVEGFANCMAALTLARGGQLRQARELALGKRGLSLVTGNCLVLQRFTSLGIAAELSLAAGDDARATTLAQEALELARARPDVNVFLAGLHGHTGATLALLTSLERTSSTDAARRAGLDKQVARALSGLKSFAQMFPAAKASYELLHGRWLASRGARRRAERSFRSALRLASESGQPFEQALALQWSAGAAPGGAKQLASSRSINLNGSAWRKPRGTA